MHLVYIAEIDYGTVSQYPEEQLPIQETKNWQSCKRSKKGKHHNHVFK